MTITIIGGGIIGLTTAFELTEHGGKLPTPKPATTALPTTARRFYPAASHYAGGMLAPIAEVQFQQDAALPGLMTASRRPLLMERLSRATRPAYWLRHHRRRRHEHSDTDADTDATIREPPKLPIPIQTTALPPTP